MLKIEDLIKGNIYYIEEGGSWAIFRFDKQNDSNRIKDSGSLANRWNSDEKNLNFNTSRNWWISQRNLRDATFKEIQWFKEAERGNIIPFNEMNFNDILNNYQII